MVTPISRNPQTQKVSLRPVISIMIYQLIFYGVLALVIYWTVTFNWKFLLLCTFVTLLQFSVNDRKYKYIHFVQNYLRPQEYFFISRIYQEQIPKQEKTLFTVHPHSVFSYGVLCNINNINFPNEKLTNAMPCGSRFVLNIPFIGLIMRLWGFQSVDPQHLKYLMKKHKDILIVPGGYEQATLTTPDEMRIFIKNRKGFIKYALKYGYTIRPVIITNQHKALQTFDRFLSLRMFMNKLKIPAVFYWCRYGLFFPPGISMHTLVGKGLKSQRVYASNQQPNSQQINHMHALYIQQLKRTYENHKQKNGNTPIAIY